MLMPEVPEYDALTRTDFNMFVERVFYELNGSTPYLDNFHIALICAELEWVRLGKSRRLAIAMPPRNLKSIIASVAYPAWLLGHDPTTKIIAACYGQPLADDFARQCRQVMQSGWYLRLFPATRLMADRQAIASFETTAGGSRRATSVGGVVTGFGADVIIVDDPTKPQEAHSDVERAKANAWARHTLFTRLNDKARGAIIIVMQRLHEDDMIGHVATFSDLKIVGLAAIAQSDENYTFKTPFGIRRFSRNQGDSIHPEREPIAVLDEVRRAIGTRFFSAQYLQIPSPPGGSIVKSEWFPRYDPANMPKFDRIVQSWDTANRSSELADYSVCTTWGKRDRQLFLLHVLRKRLEYPDLKRTILAHAATFEANTVLIEDAASGIALVQDLKSEGFCKAEAVKPKGDKVMRMSGQTGPIEAGQVFLPIAAAWVEDYLHELTMFPAGRHDDQVDSTSQALAYFAGGNEMENFIRVIGEHYSPNPPAIPNILVNHVDVGMQFHLVYGRRPVREADGSFLLTDEEYQPLAKLEGFWRVHN